MILLFIFFSFLLLWILLLIQNNGNKINITLCLFVIGILLILRLREKLPIRLYFDSILLLLIGIFIISIHIYILISEYLNSNTKNKLRIKLVTFLTKVKEIIYQNLMLTYRQIFYLFPNSFNSLLNFSIWFIKFEYKYFINLLLIIFDCIPKIILVSTCIIDICFFNKFYYFYKCIWLIIIPILLQLFFFTLYTFQDDVTKDLKKYVNMTLISFNVKNHIIIDKEIEYKIIDLQNYTLEIINNINCICIQLLANYMFLQELKNQDWYKLIIKHISYGYIIAWSYLIICTIYIYYI